MQPYPGACKNGWSQHSLTRNGRHDPDGKWDIHPPWGLVALWSGPGDVDTEHHICLRRLRCVLVRCDFLSPFNHLIPSGYLSSWEEHFQFFIHHHHHYLPYLYCCDTLTSPPSCPEKIPWPLVCWATLALEPPLHRKKSTRTMPLELSRPAGINPKKCTSSNDEPFSPVNGNSSRTRTASSPPAISSVSPSQASTFSSSKTDKEKSMVSTTSVDIVPFPSSPKIPGRREFSRANTTDGRMD